MTGKSISNFTYADLYSETPGQYILSKPERACSCIQTWGDQMNQWKAKTFVLVLKSTEEHGTSGSLGFVQDIRVLDGHTLSINEIGIN